MYKKDCDKIKSKVLMLKKNYNFEGVLHFTDFKNLETILKSGFLYSRHYCEKNKFEFIDGADHSVLSKAPKEIHKSVRFYYRGKTPTLYCNEGIKLDKSNEGIHIPIPVYLLFDEKLLYLESTRFSNGNATNSEIGDNAEFFNNMEWEKIFHYGKFKSHEKNSIINKRQAELLSSKAVSLRYLKAIIFRCEADKKRAIKLFGNNKKYRVDLSLFSDKNLEYKNDETNFIKDYSFKVNYDKLGKKKSMLLKAQYQKNWKGYETTFKIIDKEGRVVKANEIKTKLSFQHNEVKGENIDEVFVSGDEIKVLEIKGDINNWRKIEVRLNNKLSIEEFIN